MPAEIYVHYRLVILKMMVVALQTLFSINCKIEQVTKRISCSSRYLNVLQTTQYLFIYGNNLIVFTNSQMQQLYLFIYLFLYKFLGFLLLLPDYHQVMEVQFSVKIFDVRFSSDLYILKSPEYKKVVFGNWSVRMCVCMSVCGCKMNIQSFIFPKLIKIETPNFIHSTKLVHR